MKQSFCLFLAMLLFAGALYAQPARYTAAQVHAHNDYDHNTPFSDAHALQLGSIEADVFLVNDSLFVSHSLRNIRRDVLLDNAYLAKLNKAVHDNQGYAYADHQRELQLLIDLKTDSLHTLRAVVDHIKKYPALLNNASVRFVITGNQVPASQFENYPAYILFDGNIDNPAHAQQLQRIGLFSANFAKYSKWKGESEIPAADKTLLATAVNNAHRLGKKFRFWGVPDSVAAWKLMMELKVDYINTDRIAELVKFLN